VAVVVVPAGVEFPAVFKEVDPVGEAVVVEVVEGVMEFGVRLGFRVRFRVR
jgi:hypothetical protein